MTPTEFKTRFPEFSAELDARVQLFIDDAGPLFDVERWGDLYPAGVANLVAHELAVANAQTAASGKVSKMEVDVTAKKVGDVQKSRDPVMLSRQADEPYLRTTYGQKYVKLRRLVGLGAVSV